MNLIEAIDRLITERGSSAVLDKHLSFVRDQAQALEKQVEALKKENSGLIAELGECKSNLATKSSQNEFVEHKGALFKRKPEGGYVNSAYCPRCRHPMASGFDGFPFQCRPCKHTAQFHDYELQSVIKELPQKS
jgi:hypothetical protein